MRFVKLLHGAGGDRWDDQWSRSRSGCQFIAARSIAHRQAAPTTSNPRLIGFRTPGRVGIGNRAARRSDNNLTTDKPGRERGSQRILVWCPRWPAAVVKPGDFGQTDDFSPVRAADDEIPFRDCRSPRCCGCWGLDQNRLTYIIRATTAS